MNLQELNKRVDDASKISSKAIQLQTIIEKVQQSGVGVLVAGTPLTFTSNVSDEALEEIKKIVLKDVNRKLDSLTEELHQKLTGGNLNDQSTSTKPEQSTDRIQ